MIQRICIAVLLLLALAVAGCHNDRKMIDKHEQTLAAEDE